MLRNFSRPAWARPVSITLATGLVLVAAGYSGWLYSTNNFHEIVPGQLYRSAQPDEQELTAYKRDFGIRTVINLRGEHTGTAWYDEEVQASRQLGMDHFDFRMSSANTLTPEQAHELIAVLKTAKTPVLIHCKSGADRTGLASALYLAAITKVGEEAAERQLSIVYGHFSIPYLSAAYPMDDTFELLEASLGYPNS